MIRCARSIRIEWESGSRFQCLLSWNTTRNLRVTDSYAYLVLLFLIRAALLYLFQTKIWRGTSSDKVLSLMCSTNRASFARIGELFCTRGRDLVDTPINVNNMPRHACHCPQLCISGTAFLWIPFIWLGKTQWYLQRSVEQYASKPALNEGFEELISDWVWKMGWPSLLWGFSFSTMFEILSFYCSGQIGSKYSYYIKKILTFET